MGHLAVEKEFWSCDRYNPSFVLLTMYLVDLRVGGQDFICQFLCGGQHFCVVSRDKVLHQLLQLVSVHLEECL